MRIAVLVALVLCCSCSTPPQDEPAIEFKRFGAQVATLKLSELAREAETVTTFDPFLEKQKRYRALPMIALLERAFGENIAALKKRSFVLRAKDGYTVPLNGDVLLSDDAYLAIDDADVPGFEPIGPDHISPAPAYLIWKRDPEPTREGRPRPWQLIGVDIADLDARYGHTQPRGEAADSAAMQGFNLFRHRCGNCHAINREGGRVGPDLNVPQSIVEYRPEAQIRAYIQNPASFRYGIMPAHPDLSSADLDHLLAYFHAMAKQKHDPAH